MLEEKKGAGCWVLGKRRLAYKSQVVEVSGTGDRSKIKKRTDVQNVTRDGGIKIQDRGKIKMDPGSGMTVIRYREDGRLGMR